MPGIRKLLLVGTTAALLAVCPAAATANPVPCGDPTMTDEPGDQFFEPTGLGGINGNFNKLGHAAPDNVDITSLFFTVDAATGAVDANIQVTNLDKTLPSPTDSQGGIYYYAVYSYDGATRFVKAVNADGANVTYAYGNVDENGVYTTEGETTGALFEGANGVVQIRVPASIGGRLGETLLAAEATADYIQGMDDYVGLNNHVDTAPDGASVVTPEGESYTAETCTL